MLVTTVGQFQNEYSIHIVTTVLFRTNLEKDVGICSEIGFQCFYIVTLIFPLWNTQPPQLNLQQQMTDTVVFKIFQPPLWSSV